VRAVSRTLSTGRFADVVVVGSANVDVVIRLGRLPGPGETVTGGALTRAMGGKGANAAVAAARLGARVALVAALGEDADGAAVRDDLVAHGVDVGALVVARAAPTGVAAVLVDDAGENAIAVASGANASLDGGAVHAGLASAAGPGVEHGCRLVLDPGPARALPAAVLAAATVVTPNRGELAVLGGTAALLAAGAGAVAVTLGADGVELHASSGSTPVPAFAVDVVDSTGAGDAFAAGVAVALHEGLGLRDAVRFGAATGALATRGLGARAALPDRSAVDALLGV
jgi:ribokinase